MPELLPWNSMARWSWSWRRVVSPQRIDQFGEQFGIIDRSGPAINDLPAGRDDNCVWHRARRLGIDRRTVKSKVNIG